MIPQAHITHWRANAPWSSDAQIEQDLVLSRAIVEVFSDPALDGALAFRGGTALHKLYFHPAGRYSEDIDLVQVRPEPIGPVLDGLRMRLSPWLGPPKTKQGTGMVTLLFRFESEIHPVVPLRLKIEINTREHLTHLGFVERQFKIENPWYTGNTPLRTYHLEELLGTKLRALYQRKKGRDLYDLWLALEDGALDPNQIIQCFRRYMEFGNSAFSQTLLERNLREKLHDPTFTADVLPLLTTEARERYLSADPSHLVFKRLLSKL